MLWKLFYIVLHMVMKLLIQTNVIFFRRQSWNRKIVFNGLYIRSCLFVSGDLNLDFARAL